MNGMKKSYLYIALGEGVVGMRTFACWCHGCMHAIGRGEGSLDSSLKCAACVSSHFQWQERSCARTDANGVANARARAQTHARKLAVQLVERLKSTSRVAVQNRGVDDEDQYAFFIPSLNPIAHFTCIDHLYHPCCLFTVLHPSYALCFSIQVLVGLGYTCVRPPHCRGSRS